MNLAAQRKSRLPLFFAIVLIALPSATRAQQSQPTANNQKPSAPDQQRNLGGASSQNKNAPPKVSSLTLIGDRTLVLDLACNACQGAPLDLTVTAPDSLKQPQTLALRAEHLVADSGTDVSSVKISLEPAKGQTSLPASITTGQQVG